MQMSHAFSFYFLLLVRSYTLEIQSNLKVIVQSNAAIMIILDDSCEVFK